MSDIENLDPWDKTRSEKLMENARRHLSLLIATLMCLSLPLCSGCILFWKCAEYREIPDPEADRIVEVIIAEEITLCFKDGRRIKLGGVDVASLTDTQRQAFEQEIKEMVGQQFVLVGNDGVGNIMMPVYSHARRAAGPEERIVYIKPYRIDLTSRVTKYAFVGSVSSEWCKGNSGDLRNSTQNKSTEPTSGPTIAVDQLAKELSLDFGDKVAMKLVLIPVGKFNMGSKRGQYSGDDVDSSPQHEVTITQPFYMGSCEVTVGQFAAFAASAGYKTDAEKEGFAHGNNPTEFYRGRGQRKGVSWRNPGFRQSDSQPAVYISHNDAVAFCKWLSERTGKTVRLPTEAQWEYACRAGTTTDYSFGDDMTSIKDYAWYTANSGSSPHPVGRKKPNAWGLYDMHGNVWEWCSDWCAGDYYEKSPPQDPQGPASGTCRILRGGAWNTFDAWCCQSSYRLWYEPNMRFESFGFRVMVECE